MQPHQGHGWGRHRGGAGESQKLCLNFVAKKKKVAYMKLCHLIEDNLFKYYLHELSTKYNYFAIFPTYNNNNNIAIHLPIKKVLRFSRVSIFCQCDFLLSHLLYHKDQPHPDCKAVLFFIFTNFQVYFSMF